MNISTYTTMCIVIACSLCPVLASAQQSCDDYNPCTVTDMCQADGSCQGTALPTSSPCIPFGANGCTTSGMCETEGGFSVCIPVETQPDGTPCTYLEAAELGACLISAACQDGFCIPQIKSCSESSDKCSPSFCNPSSGECETISQTCEGACATCDPSTGLCDLEPMPDGTQCDDGNPCTGNDRCHAGTCVGTPGAAANPTPTATTGATQVLATTTPTRTNSPGATATSPPAPSATATQSATPTGNLCVGDCDGSGDVQINEIITCVNIALGTAAVSTCSACDSNHDGQVEINEIIQAVNDALNGCP